MSGSSFPQRAVWPKLLPKFSLWLGVVGGLLGAASLILTGISDLSLWVKIGILLASLLIPIIIYAIWMNVSAIWRRVKQYNFLYDELERTTSYNQQLQGNFMFFLQTLATSGFQMFEVTGIEWGNRSPLLAISCNQPGLVGSKIVVINVSTLDTLGQFRVVQPIIGGYFAQEDRISNAVWWGLLREEMARHPHPRVFNTIAVLLH